jgi:hypothetical protein
MVPGTYFTKKENFKSKKKLINWMNTIIIGLMKKNRIILKELKDLLVANFGDDIKSVILFGSQATGEGIFFAWQLIHLKHPLPFS